MVGLCGILNYDPSSVFGLTARGEYFGDQNGVAGFGTTFSISRYQEIFIFSNLTIIPEFRLDASGPLFYRNNDQHCPSAKSTGTFIFAATYHF